MEDSESILVINQDFLVEMNNFNNSDDKVLKPYHPQINHIEFIIYTSGSTGTPKGIMINSHSVANRLNWMWNEYPFPPSHGQRLPLRQLGGDRAVF